MRFFNRTFFRFWARANASAGNVHLGGDSARLKKIPFTSDQVYLRPTTSDVGRVREFASGIYFSRSYLHTALKDAKPSVLIDIGANIGLSSLSLVKEFESIRRIIAIEAEEENYKVLRKNFELWSGKYPHVVFDGIHGVATSTAENTIVQSDSLASLTGENSASGTFRFDVAESGANTDERAAIEAISINNLFASLAPEERVIVKIDIEGGEEHLLRKNTEWMVMSTFVTMEVHDRFHPVMLNSSKNVVRVLSESNFAIVPSKDILHCYNRDILFPETAENR